MRIAVIYEGMGFMRVSKGSIAQLRPLHISIHTLCIHDFSSHAMVAFNRDRPGVDDMGDSWLHHLPDKPTCGAKSCLRRCRQVVHCILESRRRRHDCVGDRLGLGSTCEGERKPSPPLPNLGRGVRRCRHSRARARSLGGRHAPPLRPLSFSLRIPTPGILNVGGGLGLGTTCEGERKPSPPLSNLGRGACWRRGRARARSHGGSDSRAGHSSGAGFQ